VRFEILHDFELPLEVVERAVLSPELAPMLARSMPKTIESVEVVEHALRDGELHRVLRFQASAPFPIFRRYNVAKSAMSWDEKSTYRLSDHRSTWTVTPRTEWARYVRSEGTYCLESVATDRTRRTVEGALDVRLAVLGRLVERMAFSEVKKTYDAEAVTLRQLASS
jgi:hypothetical protein